MRINKKETTRRLQAAFPSEETTMSMERPELKDMNAEDLILLYGTLIQMADTVSKEVLDEFHVEFARRSRRVLRAILVREGLIAFEEDEHGEED